MPSSVVRVTPTDYDAWHGLHIGMMREHGARASITSEVIYRDHDDPRTLVVVQHFTSLERYQEFLASPVVQEAIAKAPIEAPPMFWFLDEEEVVDIASL